MKRSIALVILFAASVSLFAQHRADQTSKVRYVDLGLPSHTLWKEANEFGYYEYGEAMRKFGKQLPTKEQMEELQLLCTWSWKEGGYIVIGPNGNSISMPAVGYFSCGKQMYDMGEYSSYWSRTGNGSNFAWSLDFDQDRVNMGSYNRCCQQPIRLVQP